MRFRTKLLLTFLAIALTINGITLYYFYQSTKDLGVDILIAESTCGGVRGIFEMRRIGPLYVKGRNEPVTRYTLDIPEASAAAGQEAPELWNCCQQLVLYSRSRSSPLPGS